MFKWIEQMTLNSQRTAEISRALAIAELAHNGQTRKGSTEPYINHPIRVANKIKQMAADVPNKHQMVLVALLHDSIEDSNGLVTTATLLANKIDPRAVVAVERLSTNLHKTANKADRYYSYLSNVVEDPIATVVKIFDTLDNISDRPSYKQLVKYSKSLQYILDASKNHPQTEALVRFIFP